MRINNIYKYNNIFNIIFLFIYEKICEYKKYINYYLFLFE